MRRWRLDLGMGGGGAGGLIGRPEPSDRKATITTTADNKYVLYFADEFVISFVLGESCQYGQSDCP